MTWREWITARTLDHGAGDCPCAAGMADKCAGALFTELLGRIFYMLYGRDADGVDRGNRGAVAS